MDYPIQHLNDNKHNHYALQLNLYKRLINDVGDYNIKSMALLHIPADGTSSIIEIEDLDEEISLILKK
jgi:hypothetical protein